MATNRERLLAGRAAVPAPTPNPDGGTRGHINGGKDPNGINVDPSDPLGTLNSLGNAALGPLAGLSAIAEAVSRAGAWLGNPRNWVRIIEVMGGSVLIIIALVVMGQSSAGPVATVAAAPVTAVKTAAKAAGRSI